jgi:rhodanese-related sulfurtransferase
MISLTLIAPERLAARLHEEDVLLLDCRKDLADADRGPRAFAEAHLPSALRAELDSDLSDLSKRDLGRHPLPDADEFSATLSRWGWHPARAVVAYDDAGGALAAARLWWMLRLVGATNVAVLDGGIQAWHALDLPLGNEVAARWKLSTELLATSELDARLARALATGLRSGELFMAAGAAEAAFDEYGPELERHMYERAPTLWAQVAPMLRAQAEQRREVPLTRPGGFRLGVWPALQGKVARGENVRAALAFVSRGEAPLGIVYATDARAEKSVRVVGTFPAGSHAPISYPVARLTASTHRDAEGFRRFLISAQGKAIFRSYGFGTR